MTDGNNEVQRKAAALARQPTIWAAETAPPRARGRAWRRTLAVARALMGVVALAVVPPTLLALVFGSPADLVPSWDAVTAFVVSDRGVRGDGDLIVPAVVVLLWLLWAVMALLLLGSLVRVVLGLRIPRWGLPASLHRLLFGLTGTAVVALAASPGPGTPPPSATAPEPDGAGTSALRPGTVTVLVGETRFEYEVKRGDTLSKISRRWLGDADRWPEICRLNRHQHQTDGARLTDCDLIFPGWSLKLPDDARPPTGLRPPAASSPITKPPLGTPTAPPSPVPATERPITTPPSTSPPSSPLPTSTPTAPSPPDDDSDAAAPSAEDGVQLSPESWVSWALAAAVSAAVAMLWRQRRRRYTGQPDDDPPTELPPAASAIRRAVVRKPEPPPATSEELPADVTWPAGGVGLVGEGAQAAARAAIVAALATGDPYRPEGRGEVVIDVGALGALLGLDAGTLGAWPRVHVADTVDDALAVIEERLLHRRRILDEHDVTSLDQLRRAAPDEEAMQPVMLVVGTPQAGARMRTKVALAVGEELDVSGLLIGEWAHGITIDVGAGGHTRIFSGQSTTPVPVRLPVLDQDAANQILMALREAHTGEPPATAPESAPPAVVPLHASRTQAVPDSAPPAVPAAAEVMRVQLRVIGPPRIEDIVAEGRPLRAKALELAVYLAVHPDGATTREIGEYLYPDARLSQADQRVHTIASNLRHVLGRAGNVEAKRAYLIMTGGRYRLDPAAVDVDVWTLRNLLRDATIATGDRQRELLIAACELSSAPLAEHQHYDWLEPHREAVRRWGTEARLALAAALMDAGEPQAASDLVDGAIALDRYNETLYAEGMRARHALGDAEGIRGLLRALGKALADLDAEPGESTTALANELRGSLANADQAAPRQVND
ncbi:BTAD domain-containing putative transcriptional regulator [Actinoplanes sp. NPDC023714]|uniref:BTAD domain-containing putative transcriptional regulator n=1 Tax=Actinoplanes sp. NPDC023714 TaxID=3154322 RepID=UPI0033DBC689